MWPAVSLEVSEDSPRPDGSFVGGAPLVPSGFAWPRDAQGDAQQHVAQIRLDELPAGTPWDVPHDGLLLFFCPAGALAGPSADAGGEVRHVPWQDELVTAGQAPAFPARGLQLTAGTTVVSPLDTTYLQVALGKPANEPFEQPLRVALEVLLSALDEELSDVAEHMFGFSTLETLPSEAHRLLLELSASMLTGEEPEPEHLLSYWWTGALDLPVRTTVQPL